MSKLTSAAAAAQGRRLVLALAATTVTFTPACQSGFSIGGLGGQKPPDRSRSEVKDGADEADEVAGAQESDTEEPEDAEADEPRRGGGIDWCRGRKINLHGEQVHTGPTWQAPGFDHTKILFIAHGGCSDRLDDEQRAETIAALGRLEKWSKLPHAEVSAYLTALTEPDPDPIQRTCKGLDLGRQATAGLAKLLRCDGADKLLLEDDVKSALGSAAAAYECLSANDSLDGPSDLPVAARYAECGAEARRVDRTAVDQELAALKVARTARTRVRISLRQIESVVAAFDAKLAAAMKGDDVLHAFFYEVPDKALRAGEKMFREGAEDVDAVRDYEIRAATNKRGIEKGCFVDLRTRLVGFVKRSGANTLEQVRAQLASPVGSQLARALEHCTRLDGLRRPYSQALAVDLEKAPDYRGPRSMVHWALRHALDKMEGPAPMTTDDLDRARVQSFDVFGRASSTSEWKSATATIKKASRREGGVHLEFETVVKKDEERECRDTNKVHSIDPNGKILYKSECGKFHTVTRRITEPPVAIPNESAAGLAAGRTVEMYCTEFEGQRTCAPLAVWKDKDKKKLLTFLGAEL